MPKTDLLAELQQAAIKCDEVWRVLCANHLNKTREERIAMLNEIAPLARHGDLLVDVVAVRGQQTWMRPHLRFTYHLGNKRCSAAKAREYLVGGA